MITLADMLPRKRERKTGSIRDFAHHESMDFLARNALEFQHGTILNLEIGSVCVHKAWRMTGSFSGEQGGLKNPAGVHHVIAEIAQTKNKEGTDGRAGGQEGEGRGEI